MDEVIKVKKKRKILPFIVGLLVLAFAFYGVFCAVRAVVNKVQQTAAAEDYSVYADYLTWVVGIDPDPFTDITRANYDDLLNIALCSLLSDEVKTGQFTSTDAGLIVPAAEVEAYFIKMFGTDVKIVHENVQGYGYQFTYDSAANTYTVPLTGVTPPFTARIDSAETTGGLVTLHVGYVGTSSIEVGIDGTVSAAEPDKYCDITLKTVDGGYNLISIVSTTLGEGVVQ